jgi:hypothetical protein
VVENGVRVASLLGEGEGGVALLVGERGEKTWQEEDSCTLVREMKERCPHIRIMSAKEAFDALCGGESRMPRVFVFPWIGPANIVDKACSKLPLKACTSWDVSHAADIRVAHAGMLRLFEWKNERIAVAVPRPNADVHQKESLMKEAVRYVRSVRRKTVKVALLDFTERASKFDTVSSLSHSVFLAGRFRKNEDCIVEGPMAYDIAVSSESARLKGFCPGGKQSRVAGDPDVLFAPDFDAGMLLGKVYEHWRELGMPWMGADISFGGRVPVLVPSRSDSGEFKLRSLVTAAYVMNAGSARVMQ